MRIRSGALVFSILVIVVGVGWAMTREHEDPGTRFTVKSITGDYDSVFVINKDNARRLKIGSELIVGDQVVVTDPVSRLSLIDGRGRISRVCAKNSPLNLEAKPDTPWFLRVFSLSTHETEETTVNASTRSASMKEPIYYLAKHQNQAVAGEDMIFRLLPGSAPYHLQIARQEPGGEVLVDEVNLSDSEFTVEGKQVSPGLYTIRFWYGEEQHPLETTLVIVEELPSSKILPDFIQSIPTLNNWLQCKKLTASPDWQWFASFNCIDEQTKWMIDELENTVNKHEITCDE